jgi:hypothetical protein
MTEHCLLTNEEYSHKWRLNVKPYVTAMKRRCVRWFITSSALNWPDTVMAWVDSRMMSENHQIDHVALRRGMPSVFISSKRQLVLFDAVRT